MTATATLGRWEWRDFGGGFGDAEARLAALTPTRQQVSDEEYVLTAASDASIKVRDGVLDVKRRLAVDGDGLEQWKPVAKAEFPLAAADVERLLVALGQPLPGAIGAVTLGALLAEAPRLRAVPVRKRRTHYEIGGCMAELSELATDAGTTRTIVVEAEDPARVWAVVRDLGLAARPNMCVARGLKALVGRRFAVLDIGTNSVKLHVAERGPDGEWVTLADRAEVTRLGEGLHRTGSLGGEPIERTVAAIAAMVDEMYGHAVDGIAAVGTAGLRIAPNADAFIDAVFARCGLVVEVLPGDEEARLAYLAATAGLGPHTGTHAVFDTGGGSSQFTFGDADTIHDRFSLDVGAVRITERFGLAGRVDESTVRDARAAIAAELERVGRRAPPAAVVGMGGANTNLAAVRLGLAAYDPDAVHGTVLDRGEIDRQIELYRTRTSDERRALVGLQPNRAEVILAGGCIVRTVLDLLSADSFTVSDRGLRHGLLAERFASPESVRTRRAG